MRIDRRTFLGVAGGVPFIFGLDDLFGQACVVPAWWKDALTRMKDLGRPGLVFVAPAADGDRYELGWALRDLLESEDSRAREIFCAAVVIGLHADVARACLPGESSPGRVLALDSSGRVIETWELSIQDLKDPAIFEERFSDRVHGKGDERLSKSAERVRSALTAEEKSALTRLSDEDRTAWERAEAILFKNSEALMPLLIHERRHAKDPAHAARLRSIIDARFQSADEKTPGSRLPFGTQFEPGVSCAAEEEGEPVQCGMARLEGKGTRFLKFLVK